MSGSLPRGDRSRTSSPDSSPSGSRDARRVQAQGRVQNELQHLRQELREDRASLAAELVVAQRQLSERNSADEARQEVRYAEQHIAQATFQMQEEYPSPREAFC